MKKNIHLIGAASGLGAQEMGCVDGPQALKEFGLSEKLKAHGVEARWSAVFSPNSNKQGDVAAIANWCAEIADKTYSYAKQKEMFVTLGGDHSCAIGTWSGVSAALSDKGPLGLIWVDAHMDAHTPGTSPSQAVHGMPLACLLGKGDASLINIHSNESKLMPENVCIIGARSYEAGEVNLLNDLGVRIFYMDEIKERGLSAVFDEAIDLVTKNTAGFGLSIDLDAIDPVEVPGVGSPEQNGIDLDDFVSVLIKHNPNKNLRGVEIAEYNPHLDRDDLTTNAVLDLIAAIFEG